MFLSQVQQKGLLQGYKKKKKIKQSSNFQIKRKSNRNIRSRNVHWKNKSKINAKSSKKKEKEKLSNKRNGEQNQSEKFSLPRTTVKNKQSKKIKTNHSESLKNDYTSKSKTQYQDEDRDIPQIRTRFSQRFSNKSPDYWFLQDLCMTQIMTQNHETSSELSGEERGTSEEKEIVEPIVFESKEKGMDNVTVSNKVDKLETAKIKERKFKDEPQTTKVKKQKIAKDKQTQESVKEKQLEKLTATEDGQLETTKGRLLKAAKDRQLEFTKDKKLENLKDKQLETIKDKQLKLIKGYQLETEAGKFFKKKYSKSSNKIAMDVSNSKTLKISKSTKSHKKRPHHQLSQILEHSSNSENKVNNVISESIACINPKNQETSTVQSKISESSPSLDPKTQAIRYNVSNIEISSQAATKTTLEPNVLASDEHLIENSELGNSNNLDSTTNISIDEPKSSVCQNKKPKQLHDAENNIIEKVTPKKKKKKSSGAKTVLEANSKCRCVVDSPQIQNLITAYLSSKVAFQAAMGFFQNQSSTLPQFNYNWQETIRDSIDNTFKFTGEFLENPSKALQLNGCSILQASQNLVQLSQNPF